MNDDPPGKSTSTTLVVLTMVIGQIISELTRSKSLEPNVMGKLLDEIETAMKTDHETDAAVAVLSYLKASINE